MFDITPELVHFVRCPLKSPVLCGCKQESDMVEILLILLHKVSGIFSHV